MNETNVANTTAILGRTNTVQVATHWRTVVFNDPNHRAAIKINSLFVTNRSINNLFIDVRIARNPVLGVGAIYTENNYYHYLMNEWVLPRKTTVIAISRDNPIWLQPGDFIQIVGSLNYCADVVCSYEYISDQSPAPDLTVTTPGQVLNLNAAPVYGTGGVHLTWTPPLTDGGVAISNYLVLWRAKVIVSTSPYSEVWTDWYLLEKPATEIPSLTIVDSVVLERERLLEAITVDNAAYAPLVFDLSDSDMAGFQFAVAAHNSLGLGPWSAPSDMIRIDAVGVVGDDDIRIGVIEAISAVPLPNGVSLDWTGHTAKLTPAAGETLTIANYRIRWSVDNGMTWLPSVNGAETNSADSFAQIRGLQNGVDYVFSIQTICQRDFGDGVDTLVGPWSPNTIVITPPGFGDTAQAQAALRAMFVRWV